MDYESCGANVVVHVPQKEALGIKDTSIVGITEGVHKAELASRRLGHLVLGLPSVSAINLVLPILEELGVKHPLLAFDADCRTNPAVAGALRWGTHTLKEQGYTLGLLGWTLDQGKGIDDVLSRLDDEQLITLKAVMADSCADTNAVDTPDIVVDTAEPQKPEAAIEPVEATESKDAKANSRATEPQIANDATTRNDESVIQIYMGLHLWKHLAELIRAAGLPDDPLLDARIILHDIHHKLKTDSALAFRKTTIAAAAVLSVNGAEGQAFLVAMKAALPGQFTSWQREVQSAQKKLERESKRTKAKALGQVVLNRGDHAELATILIDLRSVEHEYYDATRKGRYVKRVLPIATEGYLYQYITSTGTWERCTDESLSVLIQNLAGSAVGENSVLNVYSSTVDGTIKTAKARCAKTKFFEDFVPGIAFADRFLGVRGNELIETTHSPLHKARYAYPFSYRSHLGQPRRFLSLFERAFRGDDDAQDKIAFVQEFVGACRLGIAPRYQKVLFFYGPLANDGKSTIAAIIERTFPPDSVSHVSPDEMSQRFQLAPIAGALLNIVDEVGSQPIDRAQVFKQVVTAKIPIQVERKGKDPFDLLSIAGHMVLGNCFLIADDPTDGFLRRFEVVGFNNRIPDDEVVVGIEDAILKDEYEQIVHWSLDGAARLLKRGKYTIPASAAGYKEEWRARTDPVQSFVQEKLVEVDDNDDKNHAKLSDLYELYTGWASEKGHKRMAENTLGSRLQKWRVRSNEGNGYRLRPKVDAEAESKEARIQRAAEEVFAKLESSAGTDLEINSDEEKRTDFAAKQAAAKWLEELN